jgi:hypothetical protein
MTVDIDLQAQRAGEKDKAYLAYVIYRDMGTSRSLSSAYAIYAEQASRAPKPKSSKSRSPSRTYKQWTIEFDWAARIRDWEGKKRERIQRAELEADREGYTKRIEECFRLLERTAISGMKCAEMALAIGHSQLGKIGIRSAVTTLSKHELACLGVIVRSNKDAIDTLAAAKAEVYDALGLKETVDQLKIINSEEVE